MTSKKNTQEKLVECDKLKKKKGVNVTMAVLLPTEFPIKPWQKKSGIPTSSQVANSNFHGP